MRQKRRADLEPLRFGFPDLLQRKLRQQVILQREPDHILKAQSFGADFIRLYFLSRGKHFSKERTPRGLDRRRKNYKQHPEGDSHSSKTFLKDAKKSRHLTDPTFELADKTAQFFFFF